MSKGKPLDRYGLRVRPEKEIPNEDYHWYRQNSDGIWSLKPGSNNVIKQIIKARLYMIQLLLIEDMTIVGLIQQIILNGLDILPFRRSTND